jgi:NAD(P)-dependent dehydrogenase (short-subunit alcohol dehydrogenase family)
MGICDGRTAIVTGAGRGLGRAHALELARQGARVVVNDLGVALDGSGRDAATAEAVVDEIAGFGGEAVANGDNVADWDGARSLVQTALDAFGGLDVLVNNAGFTRDRMVVTSTEEEWDAVVGVHLKGHFAPTRHAAGYWRDRSKAGEPVDARVVNTSSGAGLLGSVGQAAYSAAKAGIAILTIVEAEELGRYGVTVNGLAPSARTRMTEEVFAHQMARPESGFDAMDPANVSPLVAWLASEESRDVTGQVFELEGGRVSVAERWHHGPARQQAGRWDAGRLGPVVRELLAELRPADPVYGAR